MTVIVLVAWLLVTPACGASDGEEPLVIYSGRSEQLIGPLLEQFTEVSGIEVRVKYGSTAELAATILEERSNTPADVFYAQDASGLGAVSDADMLGELPNALLDLVDPRFRSADGDWVGVSGRARTIVYNTDRLGPEDLPESVFELTDPKWGGRVGWPPTNGSFQSFVTAIRLIHGEERTRQWLEGMLANDVVAYKNNSATIQAVAAGEVDVGLANHYYLHRFLEEEGPSFSAANHYPSNGVGALINVAGAGVLSNSPHQDQADAFLRFLLSDTAQRFFADETFEFPLVTGVTSNPAVVPLSEIATPDVNLGDLSDIQGTLALLLDVGVY